MKHPSNVKPVRVAAGIAGVALMTGLLGGCAIGPQNVRTAVTSYNDWATLPADRSYTFSRTLQYRNSLELQSYEDIVRDELARQGFRPAADPAAAKLVVTLRPSVVGTRVQVRDPWPIDPFWSGYGFYGRRGYGPWGWGGFDPYWSSFNDYPVPVFHRQLELDIDSTAVPVTRYYEGKVETATQTESMQTVVPYLVRALFTSFPGNNGETRQVDVPVERK